MCYFRRVFSHVCLAILARIFIDGILTSSGVFFSLQVFRLYATLWVMRDFVLVCCHIPYRPRNPCHSLLPSIPQQLPEIPSGVCSPASPPDHPQKDLSKLGFSPCSTQLSTEPIADTGVPRLLARSALTASASRRR